MMASRPWRRWIASAPGAALLVALAGAICYANSFTVPFQYDDNVVLIGEPMITGFHPSPASRRFLGDLSFAISYRVFGQHPAGHHAVNLAVHVANALLVLWLVRLLWQTEPMRRSRLAAAGPAVALFSSLLFIVHPLQTQAVTYIVQRYASLAATFFLLATCSYIRFRLPSPAPIVARSSDHEPEAPSERRAASLGWYALFVASAGAAFWTKENAFVLPLAVLLVEIVFFSAPIRRRLLFFSPFLAGAMLAMGLALRAGVTLEQLDAATRVDTDIARTDYFLTQLRVIARYLRLLALPIGQNLDHDVALSRSSLEPSVLLAASLHAALLAGAALALVRGSRSDPVWRVFGFGVVWFYLTLLVESSFVPIVDVMYEHRTYLPSVGILLAAAALGIALRRRTNRLAWGAPLAAVVVALAGLTLARNRVWQSDLTLWADAAQKSPNKPRPLTNYGVALLDRGDTREAVELFRRAIRSDPSYAKAYFNLGEALQKLGRCEEAIPPYRFFALMYPEYPDTYRNLAQCHEQTGHVDEARMYWSAYERITSGRAGAPLPVYLR